MKSLSVLLLLLLSNAVAIAQSPTVFLHKSQRDAGRQLARHGLSFDTSFRYPPSGPEVDYIVYAPYRIADIPGVLLLRGRDSVSSVMWYSRGLDVDSDLNTVIAAKPTGAFAKSVRTLPPTAGRFELLKIRSVLESSLGSAAREDENLVVWPQCKSLWVHDGYVRFEESIPLSRMDLQPEVYDSARAAQVMAALSPGLRGLKRRQVEASLRGQYAAKWASEDSSNVRYAPYVFHGIPGILAVSFNGNNTCTALRWSSCDPDSKVSPYLDSASDYSHIIRSFDDTRVTQEQYDAIRAEVGLPNINGSTGMRYLSYYPVLRSLHFELGSLTYSEGPNRFPPQTGMHLSGVEPTMREVNGW